MDQSPKHVYGDLVVTGNLSVGSSTPTTGDITVSGTTGVLEVTDQVLISEAPGANGAAPDLAFGDGDTGLWESADDTLKVGTAGTERLSVSSAGLTVTGTASATSKVTVTVTPGAHAATPDIAFGDLDTGFYESADDTLYVATGGSDRGAFSSAGLTVIGNSGATDSLITSAAAGAHAAAPKIALGDLDTGFWESADDVLKIGTAGTERVSIDSTGLSTTLVTATANQGVLASATPGALEAAPTIALGDGDSGLWESADDTLKVGTAGVERLHIDATTVVVAPTSQLTANGVKTRVIASGLNTSIPTATATTLGTYTRNAGETVRLSMFLVDDTAQVWHAETSIYWTFTRTTNANEFVAKIVNASGTNQHADWILEGVTAV